MSKIGSINILYQLATIFLIPRLLHRQSVTSWFCSGGFSQLGTSKQSALPYYICSKNGIE